jgi:hypothetical protein
MGYWAVMDGIITDTRDLGRMVVLFLQSSPSPLHQTDTGQTEAGCFMWSSDEAD